MLHYDVGPLPAGMNALHQAAPEKPFFKGGPVYDTVPATVTSPQNGQPHSGTPLMLHYDVGPLPAGMNALNQQLPNCIGTNGVYGRECAPPGTPAPTSSPTDPLTTSEISSRTTVVTKLEVPPPVTKKE